MYERIRIVKLSTLAIAIFLLTFPAVAHSTSPDIPSQKITLHPVYATLQSRIDTGQNASGGLNIYHVLSVTFNVPTQTNATLFYSVGTFVKAGQCCPGAYVAFVSVDGGFNPRIDCGAETAPFTNVLSTLSCFARLSLANGTHTLELIVGNGGGTWTIESGSTTAILVQFG